VVSLEANSFQELVVISAELPSEQTTACCCEFAKGNATYHSPLLHLLTNKHLDLAQSLDHLLTMPVIRHAANRLPLHTARGATMRGVVSVSSRAIRVGTHGASWTISSVPWSAAPAAALVCAPASLACEEGIVEAVERAGAGTVDKGSVTEERDVVEAEVPD
jgi:hypothetical protein